MNLATMIVRKSMGVAQAMIPAYSEGAMNSLVRITRPGSWSADSGEYDPDDGTVIYADDVDPTLGAMAGIAPSSGPLTLSVGDEPEYYDTLIVYLPRSADEPWIDDLLVVMANPEADMIGRVFRVASVGAGGRLHGSVSLTCTGTAKSHQWAT
jgi:hypothetical protein